MPSARRPNYAPGVWQLVAQIFPALSASRPPSCLLITPPEGGTSAAQQVQAAGFEATAVALQARDGSLQGSRPWCCLE